MITIGDIIGAIGGLTLGLIGMLIMGYIRSRQAEHEHLDHWAAAWGLTFPADSSIREKRAMLLSFIHRAPPPK